MTMSTRSGASGYLSEFMIRKPHGQGQQSHGGMGGT